ncbi:MAG: ATP-binding protein, partial [Leptolyngbyaceae cyanobacterium CAN_BIN12]|nr:ATP-binding protein [Leptolyngbyaceae cyanobacterium CAN_BIN12]
MKVLAIDFRYQLSAFDRYFYLQQVEPWHAKKKRTPQDVLRLRSSKVLQALESKDTAVDGKADKVKELTPDDCKTLSFILGKQYRSGRILRHHYYGFWAETVVFESDSLKYTEANAGSGEIAVALLVHRLKQAEPGTLVLLDEPEYSLHPGAQKNLLQFILSQSLQKQLQIVFTTHSPTMIDGLPSEAIKVFEQDKLSDSFEIFQDRITEEAFLSIGHAVTNRTILRVEDALAKEIIETLIDQFFPRDFAQLVEVR